MFNISTLFYISTIVQVGASLSYFIEERQLAFLKKLLYSDNFILRTLACRYSVQFEILARASKYGLNTAEKYTYGERCDMGMFSA